MGRHACLHVKSFQSCSTLVTLWTIACQASLSMGLSRQEYCPGQSCTPSRGSFQPKDQICISHVSCISRQVLYHQCYLGSPECQSACHVRLLMNPWIVVGSPVHGVFQVRLLEPCNGQPFPSPGDLPNPEMNLGLLYCRLIFYHLSHQGSPWEHKRPQIAKIILKRTELEVSCCLFPGYTIRLQSSKQYSNETKINTQNNGTEYSAQRETHTLTII